MTQDTLLSSILSESSSMVVGYSDKQSAPATTIISNAAFKTTDTVTISQEALAKFRDSVVATQVKEQESQAADKSLWETKYGLTSGTVTLENGHKQVTTIKDSRMEILEYDGTTLVHKESGTISASSVMKDIEDYDDTGELTSRTHTELYFNESTGGATGNGVLLRNIEKFKNGVLIKEISDCMRTDYTYKSREGTDQEEIESLEDLSGKLTEDYIGTDYFANIKEYNDQGNLTQDTTITKTTETENETNRGEKKKDGIASHSTVERANTTNLSVTVKSYDSDGELLRQASFSDSLIKGVSETQHSDVSWYNQGQLQQTSESTYATATTKLTKEIHLQNRSSVLQTLNRSEWDYSAATPLNAEQLLMVGFEDASNTPDMYMSSTISDISSGKFSDVEALANSNGASCPYSVACKTTLYDNGKVKVEKEDSQSAHDNLLPKVSTFKTGAGLTEDKDAAYLRDTSHSIKTFDDGVIKKQSSVAMNEEAVNDARGLTSTKTNVHISSGVGTKMQNSYALLSSTLREIDDDFKAAPKNAQREIQTTLDGLYATFSRLNGTATQAASEQTVA
jgi:hypothetical protein